MRALRHRGIAGHRRDVRITYSSFPINSAKPQRGAAANATPAARGADADWPMHNHDLGRHEIFDAKSNQHRATSRRW
jgi:hypothetical protein